MHTKHSSDSSFATRPARAICLLLLTSLLAACVLMLAASFIPYSVVVARARSMSARGEVTFLDQAFYAQMQFRLRVIGLANLAMAGVGIFQREFVYRTVQRVLGDVASFWNDVKSDVVGLTTTDLLALSGLTLLGAWLRFSLLFQPMRGDEAYTFLTYASHPFYVVVSFYNTPNNHVFHSLLVRLSYLAFGNHPWALRLPVFLAGVALIPATYLVGRSLYRREAGLLAAGLVASSSLLIEYSTNARGHMLICLEFLVLILLGACALRKNNLAAWAMIAVVAAIGFYTEPVMLYPFGGVALWLLLSILTRSDHANKRADLVTFALVIGLAAFLTVELYSPIFAVSGPGVVFANKLAVPKSFPNFVKELPASVFSLTWWHWNIDIPKWLVAALACGFLLGLIFHRRLSEYRVPLAAALIVWIFFFLAVVRVIPPARIWMFALPIYFIVASAGCSLVLSPIPQFVHMRKGTAVLALVVSLTLGWREQRSGSVYLDNEGRGIEELALYLKSHLKPGDAVIAVVPSDTLLLYHFREHGVPLSYLNASAGEHVFVVVNELKGDTLNTVLQAAKRDDLSNEELTLVAQHDIALLYENTAHSAGGS